MTTPYCDYSDLPVGTCAHCTGDTLDTDLTTISDHIHHPAHDTHTRPAHDTNTTPPTPLARLHQSTGLLATMDIHDLVNDLTREHAHREPYTSRTGTTSWTAHHVTRVPSLIDQLRHATPATTGDTGAGGYASRPAAHLESLDTLIHLDHEAARWVRTLGHDDPGDTTATIQLLHGLHANTPTCGRPTPGPTSCCTRHNIERDLRRWWTQARIVTGWDSPAWRPDNTCPVCDKRGGLRIRLSTSTGLCIECRETWDDTTIGLLADHIRYENADTDDAPGND